VRNYFVVVIILVTLLSVSCGGGGGVSKKAVYPAIATPEMQAFFNQVEYQYRRKQYEHAFSGYQHFIDKFPHNKLTDEAYYKQGKIFFVKKRFAEAKEKFEILAQKSPSPEYTAKAQHMSGYASFFLEDYSQALEALKKVEAVELPAKMRIQFHSIAVKSARLAGQSTDFAYLNLLRLFDLYEEYAGKNVRNIVGANVITYRKTKDRLVEWLSEPIGNELPSWIKKYPNAVPSYSYINFKMAQYYIDQGKSSKARRLLTQFVHNYPKHDFSNSAQKLLAGLGGELDNVVASNSRYKVGVILPLTGKYETYAASVLDGIRCAVGEKDLCIEHSGVQLIVRDSGFTPASTRLAVEQLAKEGVVAIIGPLSGKLSIEAGIAATENKVPIFPITQKSGVMTQGDYIFQVGFLAEKQIEAIVDEAFNKGYRTFGVFYPGSAYGRRMSELFVLAVEERGGRITASAEFNKRSPDPFAEARKLRESVGRVGTADTGVGFDALFVPASYQSVNTLVSALEFNSIKSIPLIGTNAWNDPALTLAIAKKFPGSFFVDLYDGNSSATDIGSFKDKFISSFGRSPRVLEAYGFDIMMMIRSAGGEKGSRNIKNVMTSFRRFDGVTGLKGFELGEGPVVESVVLKIKSTGVKGK